jgi:lantibiotic modifying enzyme
MTSLPDTSAAAVAIEPSPAAYLNTAQTLATRLARIALWDGPRCNWVGSAVETVGGVAQLAQRACGSDFYNGTAGIAWFLALLLEQCPDPVLEATLDGSIAHVLADSGNGAEQPNYSYYTGALGQACALLDIGERLARPKLVSTAWKRLRQVCAQPIRDYEVDVVSGVASAIPVLLRLARTHREGFLRQAAVRAGDFLLGKARQQDNAWAWAGPGTQVPMTGYAHGAAGVALALLQLYQDTNNPAYYKGAMMGFSFERLHYNAQLQNWPDFRGYTDATIATTSRDALAYSDAWCHGAAGIALSRLRAWQLTGDESFRQEAEAALTTTHQGIYTLVTNPTGQPNFSLCHGLAGNADVLLESSLVLGNDLHRQVAQSAGNYGLEKHHHHRLQWPSGVTDPAGQVPNGEAPGLMLGLAGTGYFYLRLAMPEKIRSILVG